MANWYTTGLAGQQKFKEMEALRAITSGNKQYAPRRFKLKPGEKAKLIFLENPHVWLYEHTLRVNDRWETFTCPADMTVCPLCVTNNKRSQILVTSVIDCRKSIGKNNGKTYQYQKALYVIKGKGIRAMLRQFLDGNKVDLTHFTMEVERDTDDKSVACGEFFELGKKVSIATLESLAKKAEMDPKEYITPYDYYSLLATRTEKEHRAVAGLCDEIGGDVESELNELGLDEDIEDGDPLAEGALDEEEETPPEAKKPEEEDEELI